MGIRSGLAVALCVSVALIGTASANAANPTTVSAFGIGSYKSEWLAGYNGTNGLDVNGLFDLAVAGQANIKLYRARFREDQVLSNGAFTQWTMLDNLVRQAALRDITLEPVLINMPGEVYTPPLTVADRTTFGNFATAAARRYGPTGSFWAGCGCAPHPIKVWEVWNEENIAPFWNPPNPGQYGARGDQARLARPAAVASAAEPRERESWPGELVRAARLQGPIDRQSEVRAAPHQTGRHRRGTEAGVVGLRRSERLGRAAAPPG